SLRQLHCHILCFFFISVYGDPRDLRSFPTRRSSDLIEIPRRKQEPLVFDQDEHLRETSLEKLASLPAPFREGGSITAGNASGVKDRKSTRLNSSHVSISYAVFCLKKKRDSGVRARGS